MILLHIYIGLTILNLLLFIPLPDTSHLIGASSIAQSFVFALGVDNTFIAIFCMLWLLLYPIALIICYVYAIKGKKIPMLITVAADIAFTLFVLVCKLFLNNYTDIHYISLGFLCRAAYYWLILRKFKKDRGRFA